MAEWRFSYIGGGDKSGEVLVDGAEVIAGPFTKTSVETLFFTDKKGEIYYSDAAHARREEFFRTKGMVEC